MSRDDNRPLPARANIKGFRGTPRYASINVHREQDLGRRDDIWSILYILIEFILGDVPWGHKKEKESIGKVKEYYCNEKLLRGLPSPAMAVLQPMLMHIFSLQFEDAPDYDFLAALFIEQLKLMRVDDDLPYDWEEGFHTTQDSR